MFKLVTGSQVNVIPKSELLKWDEKPVVRNCKIAVLDYSDNRVPNLELILKEFADAFTGTGRLKRIVKIKLKENTVPHVAAPVKVPLAIHNKVKEELSNMVEAGIISKVEEPTEWVSNMVVITSPKKLRICLDPRPLNKAIQRPHYPIPTANALITKLQGGHVLSDEGIKPDPKKIRAIAKKICKDFSAVTVSVDASKNGLGAVLLQEGQPVAYGSVSLTQTQQRYAQIEKELTAVIYGVGARISTIILMEGLSWSRQIISQYWALLEYVPGKNLVIADALSRAQSTTDNFDEVLGQGGNCENKSVNTSFTN
ncbi:retrovirus-related Pol polyprotein from transposon 17.6 [Trichonephila clavipes]|nr:retrovirus-related Pol polyprotein from transposon 17.6 [Trichonephila clavipes]